MLQCSNARVRVRVRTTQFARLLDRTGHDVQLVAPRQGGGEALHLALLVVLGVACGAFGFGCRKEFVLGHGEFDEKQLQRTR